MMYTTKWDVRFLDLAQHISTWSKDPSTKVGAVIVDTKNRIVSTGYNGFPHNTSDDNELYLNRKIKYQRIVHADMNAIMFAKADLTGCCMYTWPQPPCSRCAGPIIQSGIIRCVSVPIEEKNVDRWGEDANMALSMLLEARVKVVTITLP
jgi:dCMP deaminase